MEEEAKSFRLCIKYAAGLFALLVICNTASCQVDKYTKINATNAKVRLIEAGTTPMQAHCAVQGTTNTISCYESMKD